jgi:class 3 adenylate cyclase/predicted ATPase
MECPSCRAEVSESRRFCIECGAPLPASCAACGSLNPPNAKFCGDCGAKLGAAQGAAQPVAHWGSAPPPLTCAAERRQLTVMFCDLVGSTALASRLDPEDLREVIGAYHQCVAETVGRFDGFVAKYMGDGVLVYFGYPHAHEDDAERAVRVGLTLVSGVRALKPRSDIALDARIGVATGMVVVGDLIGSGASQEQAVVGETPNLAARLQAFADPSSVVIATSTRRLVGALFEYRDLGSVRAKGFAEPVPAWQVLRESTVQSRFEAFHSTTPTPLVGREEETELLWRRWDRSKGAEGQVVLLSAEPGVGKSRLVAALQERLQGEPHIRLRYFCSPRHQDSALYPFISQLERAAGFEREETPDTRLDRLEALLHTTSTPPDDVPLLAELLSLPIERYPPVLLSPPVKKQRTLEALLRQLQCLSQQAPVLVVFEDAHWIDPTSLELLHLTIERISNLPVLMLVTFRPEFEPPWTGQPHVMSLALGRLNRRDTVDLIEQVAGNSTLPVDIVQEIVERTDGVPLFIEELTKTVLEASPGQAEIQRNISTTPAPALAVPATLHASLMARLDHLGTRIKAVAQTGAALGRVFSYELIAATASQNEEELRDALNRLTDAGLLFRRGTLPHTAYTFKHALVQDAAYGTLLRGRRRALHARIARTLEGRFPETADTQPELLAHHWAQAGLTTTAIAYCLKAGQRAMERSAMAEALAQLSKGLELLSALPDDTERDRQELDLQVALGRALIAAKGYAAPETGRAYERAYALCRQQGDDSQLFTVLRGKWVFHNVRAELPTARDLGEQLLGLAQREQDPAHLLEAHRTLGLTLLVLGEFAAARAQMQQGLALCDLSARQPRSVLYGQHSGVACLSSAAYGLWFLGYPDQALTASQEAVSWARELSHPFTLAFALYYATQVHRVRREAYDTEDLEALRALTTEQGFIHFATLATINDGYVLVMQGATAAGIDRLLQGLTAHQATGAALYMSAQLGGLAEAHGLSGQPEEGLRVMREALAFVDRTGEAYFAAELHRLRGELLFRRGDSSARAAEHEYRTGIEISRAQEARSWELRAATSLARLWRDQGKREEAQALLAPIYGWFTEGFETPDLKEAKALLEDLRM